MIEIDPLVILLIGIVTVIGMIIVLRVNAFIALITSAMLVSLLSAGELAEKIARVAEAFGYVAGKIGIVIALAAVIGKCLTDSGAADRIVRSFLRVLGERRTSTALLGSGFVLSVPVFFDTVFYLLVPLARSLWRRTHKNYMLYILAIASGAVITHTLVPPTPGPLIMADTLGVDLGTMILVGSMIGLPTAAVGLLICRVMNRLMDIPMRPYSGQTEPEPLDDSQLPSLWVSLLPVLLPVILISANTVTKTLAEGEHETLVCRGEIFDWAGLCEHLGSVDEEPATPQARRVLELLAADLQNSLAAERSEVIDPRLQDELQAALGELVANNVIAREETFAGLALSDTGEKLRNQGLDQLSAAQAAQLNWLLLEAAFAQQTRQTTLRKAAGVTAMLGNANLALLLSAAIAMFVLVRKRKLSLRQLAQSTETALMSGGIIILITAGGGAFGAMLREAGVKDSIEGLLGDDGQGVGLLLLLLGFGVAAVMKIAQGSGTVSMITTSAILAAMEPTPEMLGCHLVYLAAAIGSGSLVGSWMNDSGFWIFTRMSGLTEIEGLKSWTLLLVLLGFSSLGFTLLSAWLLPLV